jgi:hypothetical protein
MEQRSESWPVARPDAEQERRLRTALRQVEWADTYLGAIDNLELEDVEARLTVDRARQALVAVELRIRRLLAS